MCGQAFLLIYVALSVPLRIGFGISNERFGTMWFVELGVDCYFWSDILFNFRTGYFSKDGIVIYDFSKIRKAYMRVSETFRCLVFLDSRLASTSS